MWRFLVPAGLSLLYVLIAAGSLGFSALVYTRLSAEEPIATLYFNKVDKQKYVGFLARQLGEKEKHFKQYEILGDQWRIDARFIKMRSWANVIGFDSRYNLERLEGRYQKIADQNSMPTLAHDLGEEKKVEVPEFLMKYNFLMDTEFGSSAYKEIDVDSFYTVYRTQSGVIIREDDRPDFTLDEKNQKKPSLSDRIKSRFKKSN